MGPRDTRIFQDFRFCGMCVCVFSLGFGAFSVMFLHFLQKYRCVPKIGFSADISIDIFMCISIDIFISISIVIYLTFIDNEEGGRRKEWILS